MVFPFENGFVYFLSLFLDHRLNTFLKSLTTTKVEYLFMCLFISLNKHTSDYLLKSTISANFLFFIYLYFSSTGLI